MISVSVVVPVYAGELYLEALVDELARLRDQLDAGNAPFNLSEVIFVDDAAIDKSAAVIDRIAEQYNWVSVLHLSRNFGQHPATIAGILHTSGDWVVTMDEDLQHPPAAIPDLLSLAARKGADIVYGNPVSKVHQSVMRDFTSMTYKRLIERLTGNKHISKANSFRLVRGTVARAASSVCGHDTYFDVALGWFTQRMETKPMELKDARYIKTGKSGYNFRSLLSHALRLALSSQLKLLRIGAFLGVIFLMLSILMSLVLIALKLFAVGTNDAPGWTSLMILISFFGGTLLFFMGIVLEYLSVLILRAHGKPLFFTINRAGDGALRSYFEGMEKDTAQSSA